MTVAGQGDLFAWAGGSQGAWSSPTNWRDTAGGAPGSLDAASIIGAATPIVVTGAGEAASVSTHLSVLLDGAFRFGSLSVEGTLTLAGPGAALSVGTLDDAGAAGPPLIVVNADTLSVASSSAIGAASAANRGLLELGGAAAVVDGLSTDGVSCIEIGSGGGFWPGWVKVFANGTLSGSGMIAANAVVNGTVQSDGFSFGGLLVGTGDVQLLANGAAVRSVGAGLDLTFAASGARLAIAPGYAAAMGGTLAGFGPGDAIDLVGQTVAGVKFAATDAGDGVLSIAGAGGAVLGRFAISGNSAAYAAASWETVPDGEGGAMVIESAATTTPGSGEPGAYAWIGGAGGAWSNPANWRDATGAAPGSLDSVSIIGAATPIALSGAGEAASVSTHLSVLLDGAFRFGSLSVEGTLTLAGPGAALSVGTLDDAGAAGPPLIVVNADTLSVASSSAIGAASAASRGLLQLGGAAAIADGLSTDGVSCIEIGSGGGFWPGWVKVFANGTLSGSGMIAANAVVNGTVQSDGFSFGGLLVGTGDVQLLANGAAVRSVGAGLDLTFAASGARLAIAPGYAAAMGGTLAGFGPGDAIDLVGQTVAGVKFAATDAGDGVLSIAGAGGAVLGRFAMSGNSAAYAAASWETVPDGEGGAMVIESAATTTPGSGEPGAYAWIGGAGGPWNAAANWADATGSAPGPLDAVSIAGGPAPIVITGSGAAASVSTHLSVLLDGAFRFGSLSVEGTLTLAGPGAVLSVGTLDDAGAAAPPRIVVNADTLSVTGSSTIGAADATSRGLVQLGGSAAVADGLSADGNSCIEIGDGGAFWPGWVKVFADGTLSGLGLIAANAVVSGTVLSNGLNFGGLLVGSGDVQILANGASVETVGAGLDLTFAAAGARLAVAAGDAARMGGTLVGFAPGDAVDFVGQSVATAKFRVLDAHDGLLSIAGATGAILGRFAISGDSAGYAAAGFQALPDGGGGSLVSEMVASTAAALTHPS